MFRHLLLCRLAIAFCALFAAACAPVTVPEPSAPKTHPAAAMADVVGTDQFQVELLGVIIIPNNTTAFGTPVGGLSAIAYDPAQARYYLLSDDRGNFGPSRIYEATIDLSDGTLDEDDLRWTGMIPLLDEQGELFAPGALDPEGLALTSDSFFVSTEGEAAAHPPIAPAILQFSREGELVASLPLPEKFLPFANAELGVRDNKGFESLTLSMDGRFLIAGIENALAQDGPLASWTETSPVRLLTLDLVEQQPVTDQIYMVEKIPTSGAPTGGDGDNGLVELIVLEMANNGQATLLAMERSYVAGVGNTVRIYVVNTAGATNAGAHDSLQEGVTYTPVTKTQWLDFGELGKAAGIAPDNIEGLALGPQLPDNRHLLLAVSDNNFNPSQRTQLWALAIKIE